MINWNEDLTPNQVYHNKILKSLNRNLTGRNRVLLKSSISEFRGDKDYKPHNRERLMEYLRDQDVKRMLD